MTIEEISAGLAQVRTELIEIKATQSSRVAIEDLVKYLLYFWLSLSVVLGLIGWKQISDLDSSISNAVTKQFPKDSENYKQYETLISNTKDLYRQFEDLTKDYKERVDDLKMAELASIDFDLEGQVINIVIGSNTPSNIFNKEWRTRAISVLSMLRDALATRTFPAVFIFNAAQVCRQLSQFQLSEELTAAAFARDASPPIRALKLASEVANKTGPDQEKAYNELMGMVKELDVEDSPQIVLAEAWNAAESSRNYGPLLEAIDHFVKSGNSLGVPSYTHLLKAQVLLRRSNPGDKTLAKEALDEGRSLFLSESPQSQWNESFSQEYAKLVKSAVEDREQALSSNGQDINESTSQPLGRILELLQQLPEIEN